MCNLTKHLLSENLVEPFLHITCIIMCPQPVCFPTFSTLALSILYYLTSPYTSCIQTFPVLHSHIPPVLSILYCLTLYIMHCHIILYIIHHALKYCHSILALYSQHWYCQFLYRFTSPHNIAPCTASTCAQIYINSYLYVHVYNWCYSP